MGGTFSGRRRFGATIVEALWMALGIREHRRGASRHFLLRRTDVFQMMGDDRGPRSVGIYASLFSSDGGPMFPASDVADIDAPSVAPCPPWSLALAMTLRPRVEVEVQTDYTPRRQLSVSSTTSEKRCPEGLIGPRPWVPPVPFISGFAELAGPPSDRGVDRRG